MMKIKFGRGLKFSIAKPQSPQHQQSKSHSLPDCQKEMNGVVMVTNNSLLPVFITTNSLPNDCLDHMDPMSKSQLTVPQHPSQSSQQQQQQQQTALESREIRLEPGETKPILNLDQGHDLLLKNSLQGYETLLNFLENYTCIDISIGQNWTLQRMSNQNPCSISYRKIYPECWLRIRIISPSGIIDRVIEKYHALNLVTHKFHKEH